MGIVIGVEAAAMAAEAAEAAAGAAEAGEAIGSAAEAGEAIGTAAEAGEAAGAEAGEGAAAAAESEEALQTALEALSRAMEKLSKMVVEFALIDLIFKTAKALLKEISPSDPSATARGKKLGKLIEVLNESSDLLKKLTDWLKVHSKDTTNLKEFTVTTRGVLSKFIPQLGAAAGTLLKLSNQIKEKNSKKEPIKNGEIDAIEHSLQTALKSFKSLADFKEQHKSQIKNLGGMPIDEKMVSSMQAKMP